MSIIKIIKLTCNPKNFHKIFKVIKSNSITSLLNITSRYIRGNDIVYEEWLKHNEVSDFDLAKQSQCKFKYNPKVSILVPVFNTPETYLKEMLISVINQTYSNWELCISDSSDDSCDTNQIIRDFCLKDNRIKYIKLNENKGIAHNTNEAIKISTGDYLAFLDHDDVLSTEALFQVVSSLNKNKYDLVYSDEDFINDNSSKRMHPIFKPDWSPDLLCSHNYITHFCVIKKSLVDEVGWLDSRFDGAQDYDLIFKCTEKANSIYHIPKILYHWRICENSVASDSSNKLYAYESGKRAIEEHLKRINRKGKVEYLTPLGYYHTSYEVVGNPLISIIIPNKDHVEDLSRCIKSLYEINNYKNFEILVCENNSKNNETFEYYEELKKRYHNISILYYEDSFNFAAINNYASKFAKGEFLLFLNNDTKMIDPNSLSEMLSICLNPDTGVVGAKLYYKNKTVQHAGVVVGLGGSAQHVFLGIKENDFGYSLRSNIVCNYSAVTGACLMTKRKLFNKVKGFSEDLAVSFNDIDFCLKIRELGKYVVYTPFSTWFHYESLSRGYDKRGDKKNRFMQEKLLFIDRWSNYFSNGDPYYNINFKFSDPPYCLRYW